jgi:hypothetical protein
VWSYRIGRAAQFDDAAFGGANDAQIVAGGGDTFARGEMS